MKQSAAKSVLDGMQTRRGSGMSGPSFGSTVVGEIMALLRKEDIEPIEPPPSLGAVLGPQSRFEGKLTFEGAVRIDGEFVGDIDSPGTLLVGESAHIEGTVRVANATVAGAVVGTLIVAETLEIESMGRVSGEIHVSTLITARGAVVDGSIKMPGEAG